MLLPAFDCGEGLRAAAAAAAAALGQNGWYICGSGSAYERRAEGGGAPGNSTATVKGGCFLEARAEGSTCSSRFLNRVLQVLFNRDLE